MLSAGCTLVAGQPVMRTVPPLTTAAAEERDSVRQIRFDVPVPGRDQAGPHLPAVGRQSRRRRLRLGAASPPSWRCAAPTAAPNRCVAPSGPR